MNIEHFKFQINYMFTAKNPMQFK